MAGVADGTPPRQSALPRAKLLIVEDEAALARALSRIFENEVETTVAQNGRVALARFHQGHRFDAIVCDLMMPELTGMDLHAELTRFAGDQAERMIFVTGGAYTGAAKEFLGRVPNARVEKPFDRATLRALVLALLHRRHA